MNECCKILIVEDSPEDRAVYRRRIGESREREYQLWETGSGEEGLRLYREIEPDCLLLDYQLPDIDGLEFLDRLQTESSEAHASIIMLTGHGNEAVAVEAMKRGAHDYLVKGFSSDALLPAIESAIAKRLMRRQIDEQRRELERLSAERLDLIAELQKHTAALSHANRSKDEFLAMLAHELRNPLASIGNTLQIMQLAEHDPTPIPEVRAIFERQLHSMVRLIDDLLDVSRITRGKVTLCKQPQNLIAIVERAVETCRPLIQQREHELSLSMPSTPLYLEADPVRVEQVIVNLLENAAKYTPPGGRISLEGEREGSDLVFRVRDNGIGIAPEMLPRIFEIFTQADHSFARTTGGLGIGLTLVQQLVQLHGGTVHATSPGLGLGASFVVRLPALSQGASPPERGEQPVARVCRSLRVLVVDDNVDAGRSVAMLLQLAGHTVHLTHEGRSAIDAVTMFRPQVALLDIGMPEMDGYEVARQIRCLNRPNLMLIAVTGYGREQDRRRAQTAGFDHHLVKPLDLKVLEGLFAAVLC